MLESSESKSHPDYAVTVKQVAELQQHLQQMSAGQTTEPATSTAQTSSSNQPASKASDSGASTPSTTASQSQTMDYNLSQAIQEVDSITSGLQRLRENDINEFNRLGFTGRLTS